MTLNKILIATDFSDHANIAFMHSMAIAHHTGAKLTIMNALGLSLTEDNSALPAYNSPPYTTQLKKIEKEAREKLEAIRVRNHGQGVQISHVFVSTMPEIGIETVAKEMNTDLIVVGSHGRNRVSAFFLGSVSQRIVKKSFCDVLVARGDAPRGGYKKILVPTDFSRHSKEALNRAMELVEPGGVVELFHCWQLPGGSMTYWGNVASDLHSDIQQAAQKRGASWVANYAESNVNVSFVEKEGPTRHCIETRVTGGGFDLVVMGAHGGSGFERLLLGSVAESAASHLKVPVYLVHGHE